VLIAINPAQLLMKARDSQRLQDMDTIHKALGLSLADAEITLRDTTGCASCTSSTGTQAVDGNFGYVKFDIPATKTGLSKYLATLPVDPTNDDTAVPPLMYVYAASVVGGVDGGNDNAVFEIGTSLTII